MRRREERDLVTEEVHFAFLRTLTEVPHAFDPDFSLEATGEADYIGNAVKLFNGVEEGRNRGLLVPEKRVLLSLEGKQKLAIPDSSYRTVVARIETQNQQLRRTLPQRLPLREYINASWMART